MDWADIFGEAVHDTMSLLPLLFLTYILLEYLEHHMSWRTMSVIGRAGRFGPVIGGLIGIIPQCGFSAAAAGLYARRILTTGTLLAVFLSTSDEMLPIFIAAAMPPGRMGLILALKAGWAVVCGFAADGLLRVFHQRQGGAGPAVATQRRVHTHKTGLGPMLTSAAVRTIQVTAVIFLITLVLNMVIDQVGLAGLRASFLNRPLLGQALAALLGLIPNCAVSVALATLYVDGAATGGVAMAGLFSGAGVGLLMLFGANRGHRGENILILVLLWVFAVIGGLVIDLFGLL